MSELLTRWPTRAGEAVFPVVRPRRLRRTAPALRELVRETSLRPADFVYPVFVTHGRDVRVRIGPHAGAGATFHRQPRQRGGGGGATGYPRGAPLWPAADQGRARFRRVRP